MTTFEPMRNKLFLLSTYTAFVTRCRALVTSDYPCAPIYVVLWNSSLLDGRNSSRKNRVPEACGDPLCTVAHGIFAHWWSTHGALQLPVAWQTRSAPYERNGDVRKPWCPKCQNFPSNVDAFLGFQGVGKYSQSVGALRRILGVRSSQPAPASAVKWGVGFHPGLRNITGANFSCASRSDYSAITLNLIWFEHPPYLDEKEGKYGLQINRRVDFL